MKPFFSYSDEVFEIDDRVQNQIKELSIISSKDNLKSVWAILSNYLVIAALIWTALAVNSLLVSLLCIFLIGCRQHALLILMHDAAHYNLFSNSKINNLISDLACAYPHFITTAGYRRDHFEHHKFVNSDKDPNWISKAGKPEWEFPMGKLKLVIIFLGDLFGRGILRILGIQGHYYKVDNGQKKKETKKKSKSKTRLVYYLTLLGLITYFEGWQTYLIYWMIPLFCVLPLLLRIRILSEHHGLPQTNDLSYSRNYISNFVERYLFSPHNVCYHLDHHLFANVPFHKLPKLHAILKENEDFNKHEYSVDGIFVGGKKTVLKDLTYKTPVYSGGRRSHSSP